MPVWHENSAMSDFFVFLYSPAAGAGPKWENTLDGLSLHYALVMWLAASLGNVLFF
jgi:hypothetical protein